MVIKSILKNIKAVVSLPASKSESNRVLILKALSNIKDDAFFVQNLSEAEDTKTLSELLSGKSLDYYNVGHAGTAMRFLTAYFALQKDSNLILTGSDRMQNRPIKILVDALKEIGANVHYTNKEGYPPLVIKGARLLGGELSIDSSVSSQYISALLMIAPLLDKGLELSLKGNLVSKPYLDMTINLMKYFGVEVLQKENVYSIKPQSYLFKSITIESDWSAASYWYEIAALSSSCEIELKGLKSNSRQGDQELIELFKVFGVNTRWIEGGIIICKSELIELDLKKNYIFNLENTPDLAQTIICTCAGLGLKAEFTGLSTLKIKETDRLLALKTELNKFNVQLNIGKYGGAELLNKAKITTPNLSIATYEDHRMAMAFAPLALVVGRVDIENSEVVKKSYPNYWNDLNTVFELIG